MKFEPKSNSRLEIATMQIIKQPYFLFFHFIRLFDCMDKVMMKKIIIKLIMVMIAQKRFKSDDNIETHPLK